VSSDTGQRTQEERRAATRASILAAARDLFAERGYHGCAVDAILERAGSSKGAFYHHFADKAAVLEALLEEFEQESIERAVAWTAGLTSTIEIMRVTTRSFLDWCTDPYIRQVVLTDALAVLGSQRWHAIDDRYTLDALDQLLQRGVERGELRPMPSTRTMARLIVGATNELALFVAGAPDPATARDEAISAFDVLFEALAAGASPAS
jgi:AcrR family transcriptional regulator